MVVEQNIKLPFFKRVKRKLIIFLVVLFLIFISLLLYLNYVVNPVIISTSSAKVRSLSQRAVENAVKQVINSSVVYDTLVMITRDNNGKIVTISSNSATINMLALELSDKAQSALSQMGATGIDIPIGSFSGMPIFTGRGPTVNIKMLPIGTINCKFESTFTEAGINQTNHRIFLKVISSVSVILPTANQVVKTETQLMISESIIVGEIPQTYLHSNTDEMLNLLP
ncbi:MAG: sporulation protein YunB [Eubacteriales bacterium]|nr:sporulation protein YunB [Eubacteriales bacterium]